MFNLSEEVETDVALGERIAQEDVILEGADLKLSLKVSHNGVFTWYSLYNRADEEIAAARLRVVAQDNEAALGLEVILVRPDYRRKGVADRLLSELIAHEGQHWTISLHVEPIELQAVNRVSVSKLAAFYKSHGFEMVNRRQRRMVRPASRELRRALAS